MTHQFFIDCEPPRATAQGSNRILKNKKTGQMFVGRSSNSNATKAKKLLSLHLMQYRPKPAFTGPVSLWVHWTYPWLKGATKAERSAGWRPSPSKPDCDNLSKILNDSMTELNFWTDDAQVFDLHFIKGFGDRPGIAIKIEDYEEINPMAKQLSIDLDPGHSLSTNRS